MTALVDPPATELSVAADRDPARLLPISVNLLPDEIVAARGARSARRVAAGVLLGAVVATGGWYAASMNESDAASTRLSAVEAQAAQTHRGSNSFAALNQVKSQIKSVRSQLAGASTGDVAWADVNDAIRGALPSSQVAITGLSDTSSSKSGSTPTGSGTSAAGTPAQPTGSVQINGAAAANTLVSRFVDNLGKSKLLSDAFVTNLTTDPKTHQVQFTINVATTTAALNPRYQKVGKR